jgi:hypothetical protein
LNRPRPPSTKLLKHLTNCRLFKGGGSKGGPLLLPNTLKLR